MIIDRQVALWISPRRLFTFRPCAVGEVHENGATPSAPLNALNERPGKVKDQERLAWLRNMASTAIALR